MDAVSEVRLKDVHPELARRVRQMSDMLELEGITIRVTQGLRSWAEQAKLYDQGRSEPGVVVTNAQPGHSYHQFGLAADVVPLVKDGQADWNPQHPAWQRLVAVGTSLGLESGSLWRSFPDYPHFQLTGKFPISPNDEARQILTNEGMQAFWQAADLQNA